MDKADYLSCSTGRGFEPQRHSIASAVADVGCHFRERGQCTNSHKRQTALLRAQDVKGQEESPETFITFPASWQYRVKHPV